MVASASILKQALELGRTAACSPGAATVDVDRVVRKFIESCGARPVFLGHDGFPAAICISINDQVVHCVPSSRTISVGDLISIDCGVEYNGAITDACRSFFVGKPPSLRAKRLVDTAYSALTAATLAAQPGARIGDLSFAVQLIVEPAGFTVSREFVGHAVGKELHQPPWIPNYGRKGTGALLKPGMFLAIEPVIFDGDWRTKAQGEWDIVSLDGCLSAHVENTVYISHGGPVVLT